MKQIKILFLILTIFSSCTVVKRHYESGFYIRLNARIQKDNSLEENHHPKKELRKTDPLDSDEVNLDSDPFRDTILPPSVPPEYKTKETEPDYSPIPDVQTRMELEADTIIKKSTDNMALFGGVTVTSLLLLGIPVEWTFVLITVAVVGFVWVIRNAIKTAKRLSKFRKQYREFSDNKKYKKAMKLGSFNHLMIALAALVIGLVIAALVVAVFSMTFI
jgi:hypothetical protein